MDDISRTTTLYKWTAKRSGAHITVKHSAGKVAVDRISVNAAGWVVATGLDGKSFRLSTQVES